MTDYSLGRSFEQAVSVLLSLVLSFFKAATELGDGTRAS